MQERFSQDFLDGARPHKLEHYLEEFLVKEPASVWACIRGDRRAEQEAMEVQFMQTGCGV